METGLFYPSPHPVNLPPSRRDYATFGARNSKSAVELAKSLHKRLPTAATEALLVKAYCPRRGHAWAKLVAEAEAFSPWCGKNFPGSAPLLRPNRRRPGLT